LSGKTVKNIVTEGRAKVDTSRKFENLVIMLEKTVDAWEAEAGEAPRGDDQGNRPETEMSVDVVSDVDGEVTFRWPSMSPTLEQDLRECCCCVALHVRGH
jgi:hypothetical protein